MAWCHVPILAPYRSLVAKHRAWIFSHLPPDGADSQQASSDGACSPSCGVPVCIGVILLRDRMQRVPDGEPADLSPQRETVGRSAPERHAGVHPRVGIFLCRLRKVAERAHEAGKRGPTGGGEIYLIGAKDLAQH